MNSIKMSSTSSPNSDVAQSCRWAASTSLRTSASSTQVGDDLSASDTIRRPGQPAERARSARAAQPPPPERGRYVPYLPRQDSTLRGSGQDRMTRLTWSQWNTK